MTENKIGAKIVLDGEKEYRESLKNIGSEQKELRSEMKLCNAEFKENQNSVEALTQKQEILSKQTQNQQERITIYSKAVEESTEKQKKAEESVEKYSSGLETAQKEMDLMSKSTDSSKESLDAQQKVVDSLQQELEKASKEYSNAENSTRSWQTSLNNAQSDLLTMESELNKNNKCLDEAKNATDGCATSIDEYGKSTDKASEDTLKFGDVLKANLASDVIVKGLEKIADLAKQVGEELLNAAIGAADYADNIMTMSTNTGIAADTLQVLTYAEELMDVSVNTVTSSMAKNIKSMNSARDGSESFVKAYGKMRVEYENTDKTLRDSQTVFWECIDALGKMENATDRDAVAMTVFGKSAQSLNSLIAIGSAGFKEFSKEAHQVGYVMSDDMMSTLLDTSDALERLTKRVDTVKNKIGYELAPVLEESCDRIASGVEDLQDDVIEFAEDVIPVLINGLEWIIDNSDLILTAIVGIGTATLYNTAMVPAITALKGAWTALNTAMSANPVGVVVTAVIGLTAALATYCAMIDKATITDYESAKALREQADARWKNIEAIGESIKNSDAEAIVLMNLKDKIVALNEKEALSTKEKAEMITAVTTLNEKLPDLNLTIDNNTGKLVGNTKALENNVDALIKSYAVQCMQEDLAELAREYYETQKDLVEIEKELGEATETLTEKREDLNNKMYLGNALVVNNANTLNDYALKMSDTQRTIGELTEAQEASEAQQSDLSGQIEAMTESIKATSEELIAQKEATEATTDVQVYYKDAMYEIKGATEETATAISDLQTSYYEAKTAAYDSISSQVGLFEELKIQSDLTAVEMAANLETQTGAYTKYTDDLNTAAAMLAQEANPEFEAVLTAIMDMGMNGAGYLNELVTAAQTNSEEFAAVMEGFADMTAAKELLSETMGDIQTDYSVGMENLIGIQEEKQEAQKTVTETGCANIFTVLSDNNDAIVTDTETTLTEMNTKIVEQTPVLSSNMTTMAQSMINAVNIELGHVEGKEPVFKEIGISITQDLANGIEAGTSTVSTALGNMVNSAVNSMDISEIANKIDKKLGEAFGG